LARKQQKASGSREGRQPDSDVSICLGTFDQYRSLLFSIAYRMIGSVADAEDMLQETFIRWQQSREEEIESPRAFLVTIISRLLHQPSAVGS
jgi:RNA polymerase sigma-70 factor (ECF subfamily)